MNNWETAEKTLRAASPRAWEAANDARKALETLRAVQQKANDWMVYFTSFGALLFIGVYAAQGPWHTSLPLKRGFYLWLLVIACSFTGWLYGRYRHGTKIKFLRYHLARHVREEYGYNDSMRAFAVIRTISPELFRFAPRELKKEHAAWQRMHEDHTAVPMPALAR